MFAAALALDSEKYLNACIERWFVVMAAVTSVDVANIIAFMLPVMVMVIMNVINVMLVVVFMGVMAFPATISITRLKLGIATLMVGVAVCGKCQPSKNDEDVTEFHNNDS